MVGRELQIDYRSPGGEAGSIRRDAAELVALAPDVILSVGSSTTGLLLQATNTIRCDREFGRPGRRWLCPKPGAAGGNATASRITNTV